jgi:hypothetical protein
MFCGLVGSGGERDQIKGGGGIIVFGGVWFI